MKLLVWLMQFVPPSTCLSLGLSCYLACYCHKISCYGLSVSLIRVRKGPKQTVKQLKLSPHCKQPREHTERGITSSHQMGSFSWLRQQRVRSAARQSFCRASTSPQGTAYSHGVMSSESCSPPALPRLLVVRHRVLLPMMQPPAVKLCWLLYRLAWTWQLPVWPQRNEMPLIFFSCRCWAEDAQCYLHQGSLQGSFGVVSDQCMVMSVCIHPFLNIFSGFLHTPFFNQLLSVIQNWKQLVHVLLWATWPYRQGWVISCSKCWLGHF